jgi:hypothetical protein
MSFVFGPLSLVDVPIQIIKAAMTFEHPCWELALIGANSDEKH